MDGVLLVNKSKGPTSHDVVNLVRRRFGLKKVGHAGTLDPMATGVLVVLVGKYTKRSDVFMSDEKEYEATLVLGATSDTGDAWGKIEPRCGQIDFTKVQIEDVFKKFLGEIEQLPPMYSSVKFKGRKLYELARKGIKVDVKPRTVIVKNMDVQSINIPEISFRVTCSKGTYIRKIAMDIGEVLGCGAYLSKLSRTRSGSFAIDEAVEFDALKVFTREDLQKRLLTI